MLGGKSILVIGVGPGLGREIARVAHRDGASVFLAARREDNLRAAAAELDPTGERVGHCATDITDPEQLAQLMAAVDDRFGKLDGLVICASYDAGMGGIEATSDKQWRDTFEVNVFATAATVRAAFPLLKRQGGSVVFIGSQQWVFPARDVQQLAYGSSKGAAVSMMYGLAPELGAHKIRVNTVVPSWMWGPNVGMYVDWQSGVQGRSKDEIRADLDAKFALGEMATDRDVAEAVGFFLSDRARSITGQSLLVNAGELAR
ncbi:MAG TPA: SDR family oxidoreductase [Mycobacteriales bacterium]|nr:SDR family oxidoreductase [Mycobacteriales bacterium]